MGNLVPKNVLKHKIRVIGQLSGQRGCVIVKRTTTANLVEGAVLFVEQRLWVSKDSATGTCRIFTGFILYPRRTAPVLVTVLVLQRSIGVHILEPRPNHKIVV